MSNPFFTDNDPIRHALRRLLEQKEQCILNQLKDLVDRNILILEKTEEENVLIQDHLGQLTLAQTVKVKVKDQEYILKLEEENRRLRERLELIAKSVNSE